MKTKRVLWFLSVVLGVVLFSVSQNWAQSKPENKGPIITNAFAVEKGTYGFIWKIYLEAEDPDGQMLRIASVVDEPGVGRYPTDWVYLKPQYGSRFKGYLQWNTFSSLGGAMKEGDRITLRVSVIDKAGRESNEVVFPFTFVSGAGSEKALPAPFDQQNIPRIGHITIDLVSPGKDSIQ